MGVVRRGVRVMGNPLRASAGVSAAVFTSRILGLGREALFAALFGSGAAADAFQVAFRIPNLLRDLFAEGALSSAFIPTFTAVAHHEGDARAQRVASLAGSLVVVVTGLIAAAGMMFAGEVVHAISGGFAGDQAKAAMATRLTRLMMPFLTIISLSAVWAGVLNAKRRFLTPAYAPVVFNAVMIAAGATLVAIALDVHTTLIAWSAATVVAGLAQLTSLVPALWRGGFRIRPRLKGAWSDPAIRRILRLMAPAVAGLAAIQINIFVNTRFAANLGDGPLGQLNYAFRLFYLPVGIFGVALATVTTTTVAEEAARGDVAALRSRTREGLAAALMLTTASAVGLAVLAEPVVTLIYKRGAFTSADAVDTAWILRAYLVGLVTAATVKILAPAFYSIDRPRVPLVASFLAVVSNIVFNALTYRDLGAPGIALGTAIGSIVNTTVLLWAFRSRIGGLWTSNTLRHTGTLLFANGVLAAVVGGVWLAAAWANERLAVPYSWLEQGFLLLAVLVTVAVGFATYAGLLSTTTYPGAKLLREMPRRLLSRVLRRKTDDSS